jgi:hypothetical protein
MKLSKFWRQPPRCSRNRVRLDDLAPDGVRIVVRWDKFPVGASVFIPCVNTLELVRQVHQITTMREWVVHYRPGIEGGRWGVRIWRRL